MIQRGVQYSRKRRADNQPLAGLLRGQPRGKQQLDEAEIDILGCATVDLHVLLLGERLMQRGMDNGNRSYRQVAVKAHPRRSWSFVVQLAYPARAEAWTNLEGFVVPLRG